MIVELRPFDEIFFLAPKMISSNGFMFKKTASHRLFVFVSLFFPLFLEI